MSKRILSLALVVMMLAAFIPSTLFSASAADTAAYRFQYNFTSGNSGFVIDPATGSNLGGYVKPATVSTYAHTHGFWKYHGSNGFYTGDAGFVANRAFLTFEAGSGRYLALKLNVPASGTFDATIRYWEDSDSSATADYFLLPGDTVISDVTALEDTYRLADDFGFVKGSETATYATKNGIELTKGEYIFVVRPNETESRQRTVYPKSLEFQTTGASSFEPVYVGTVGDISVEADATATATAKVRNAWDFTELTEGITFDTANDTIATVSDITVTGKKGGKTELTATVDGAESRIIPGTVTVKGTPYQFKYNFVKDATYDISGLTRDKASDSNYYQTKSIKDYAMTHGAWKFNSKFADSGQDHSNGKYYGLGGTDTIHFFGAGTGRHLAYDINVPVSGIFDVTITSSSSASGAADYYLLPGGTDISDPASISESTPGAVLLANNYASTSAVKTDVTVEKGEYILFIKLDDSVAAGKNVRFNALEFKSSGETEFESPYIGTIDPVTVGAGAEAEAKARVYNAYTGEELTEGITFDTAEDTIATVSGTTVKGVKKGTTELTAKVAGMAGNIIPGTVTVTGRPYQFKYTFNSDATHVISGVTPSITYIKNNTTFEDITSITDYAMTHGAWKYYGHSGYNKSDYGMNTARVILTYGNSTGRYFAVKLNVPADGTFDITLKSGTSVKSDYFLLPGDTVISDITAIDTVTGAIKLDNDYTPSGNGVTKIYSGIDLEKGEYLFVVRLEDTGASGNVILYDIEMKSSGATTFNDAYVGTIDPVTVDAGAEAEAKARVYNAYTGAELTEGITFDTAEDTIATVSGTTVKGVKKGTTELTATVDGAESNIIPGTVTVAAPAYQFTYTFNANSVYEVPDLGLAPKNDGIEYTYSVKTITDYAMTKGLWKYYTSRELSNSSGGMAAGVMQLVPVTSGEYFLALKLNVPADGTYDVTLATNTAVSSNYYLLPGDTAAEEILTALEGESAEVLFENYSSADNNKTAKKEGVELTKGEYIFVIKASGAVYIKSLSFATSGASSFAPVYVGAVDSVSIVEGGTATAKARIYNANDGTELTSGYTFDINDSSVASLSGASISNTNEGITEITATLESAAGNIIPGKLTVANKALTDAFNATKGAGSYNAAAPTALVYLKDGTEETDTIAPVEAEGTYTYTAPEKAGYKFLYWAKGAIATKKILGFDAELTYIPTNGSNIVIAVYEKANATETPKAEFYSGNGQLVAILEADGKAPALPEIPGYEATHWQNTADETMKPGDEVTLSGATEIWVAQYTDADDITIKATNATGAGTYAYGELVTLEANGTGTFRYWEKTTATGESEIVGFKSTTYSFYAWEDCTVEAVYGNAAPVYTGGAMKILIDTFGTDSVMAEFIGFEDVDVLEKGIMLDGAEFAMTSDNMQFTLSDVGDATVKGYAIIKEGSTISRIEDGE